MAWAGAVQWVVRVRVGCLEAWGCWCWPWRSALRWLCVVRARLEQAAQGSIRAPTVRRCRVQPSCPTGPVRPTRCRAGRAMRARRPGLRCHRLRRTQPRRSVQRWCRPNLPLTAIAWQRHAQRANVRAMPGRPCRRSQVDLLRGPARPGAGLCQDPVSRPRRQVGPPQTGRAPRSRTHLETKHSAGRHSHCRRWFGHKHPLFPSRRSG